MQSQREKIKKAIELLKKGTPVREIGKELHLSYTTICLIKKRMALHSIDEKEKSKTETTGTPITEDDRSTRAYAISINNDISKHSRGLNLLLKKKSLVEISILLDLEANETLKIYNDFLILQKMEKVATILIAQKNNLDVFINLESHIIKNNIDIRKLWCGVDLEKENFNLKRETKNLRFEKDTAVDVKEFWKEEFVRLNGNYQNLLKQTKRKRLISVQHTSRSLDNRIE